MSAQWLGRYQLQQPIVKHRIDLELVCASSCVNLFDAVLRLDTWHYWVLLGSDLRRSRENQCVGVSHAAERLEFTSQACTPTIELVQFI